MAKRFLDTNIFVYANDSRDPGKQRRAIELVTGSLEKGDGVISTQVLMEYAAVAIAKLNQPLEGVLRQLNVMEHFEVVGVTGEIIRNALTLKVTSDLSFWDSVIVQTAMRGKCEMLCTEDMVAGAVIGTVRIQDPFR